MMNACLFCDLQPDWEAIISATKVLPRAPYKLFIRCEFYQDFTPRARGKTRGNHGCWYHGAGCQRLRKQNLASRGRDWHDIFRRRNDAPDEQNMENGAAAWAVGLMAVLRGIGLQRELRSVVHEHWRQ